MYNINVKVNKYITRPALKALIFISWADKNFLFLHTFMGTKNKTEKGQGKIEPQCTMSIRALKSSRSQFAPVLEMCILLLMLIEVRWLCHFSVRAFKHLRRLEPLALLQDIRHTTYQHLVAIRLGICFMIFKAVKFPWSVFKVNRSLSSSWSGRLGRAILVKQLRYLSFFHLDVNHKKLFFF